MVKKKGEKSEEIKGDWGRRKQNKNVQNLRKGHIIVILVLVSNCS